MKKDESLRNFAKKIGNITIYSNRKSTKTDFYEMF